MTCLTTKDDIKKLGSILCVWAHPDDETFNCGGIMSAAIQNGQAVVCITATKGEAGVQDESRWPAAKLGDIRAKELQAALKIMGVHHHHWLGYRDGECDKVSDEEGSQRIKEFIELYQPDTILTFGPDGMTGHPDHQAMSRWATLAAGEDIQVYYSIEERGLYEDYLVEADKKKNIFFNIDKPSVLSAEECDIAFRLSSNLCQLKKASLEAMPSQMEGLLNAVSENFVPQALCVECFVKAK